MAADEIDTTRADKTTASTPPSQLDLKQTTTACKVLLKNISDHRAVKPSSKSSTQKQDLLAGDTDEENSDDEQAATANGDGDVALWLILTTKKHITHQSRLKPGKISLPHHINNSPTSSICLITADPQRTYKDVIAHPSFPEALRARIARVISLSKLKAKYKPYENRRQLLAEHDYFLADDRVVTALPGVLGKVFYSSGSKRPVPISISGQLPKGPDGKPLKQRPSDKKDKIEGGRGAASPLVVAREIERALSSALINISAGATTSVRIGHSGMAAEAVSANLSAVVDGMVAKYIPQGWRNIRALHVKGPNTTAFPVWMASELWVEDGDVQEEKKIMGKKRRPQGLLEASSNGSKTKEQTAGQADPAETQQGTTVKRKAGEGDKASGSKHIKKKRRADEAAAAVSAESRERTRRSKAQAMAAVGGVAV